MIGLSSILGAQTPAPGTTPWESESLKLRLFYPSILVQQNSDQAMRNGQLMLPGILGATDSKPAEVTHCLRPTLLLTLPPSSQAQTTSSAPAPEGGAKVTVTPFLTASLLLAELDVSCISGSQSDSTNLLTRMAEIVNTVPGMNSIVPPSTYTIGWQTVHMAAAQGQPPSQPFSSAPVPAQQLFTMGISTNWQSHLLFWYFCSNSIETLNRITKTTVRFGRAQAAPLYPVVIGATAP